MNLIRKAFIVSALVFALMPSLSIAQYQHTVDPFWSNLGNPRRYELGGTMVMSSASFTGVVTVNGPGGVFRGDTTAKRPLPGAGFGALIGVCLPFKATGHISCWAVAAQLMANMYTWNDLNQTLGTDGAYKPRSTPLNGATTQVTLPIGIDYKIGNDAIMTKRLPLGASFGIGAMPQLQLTTLEGIGGFKPQWGYGCTPYAKFDLSVFTGLCWKLRFMYTMGNINLLDVNDKVGNLNQGTMTISQGSQFMVSFVLMPFSGGWREYAWYNTHDTYNQHDKFN